MNRIFPYIILFIIAVSAVPVISEEPEKFSGIAFVDELSEKNQATVGDAVTFTVLIAGGEPEGFEDDLEYLKELGIQVEKLPKAEKLLTRSEAAFLAAQLLKLDDSLMYLITKSGVYALTACKARGIITGSGGSNMPVSGGELIDIMTAASRFIEIKTEQTKVKDAK